MASLLFAAQLLGEALVEQAQAFNDQAAKLSPLDAAVPDAVQLQPVVHPIPAVPKIEDSNPPLIDYQPSFLLKAYAHALLPQITLQSNLSPTSQKFFLASPLQRGIPYKGHVFMNEQLFQHANSVQTNSSPIFQSNMGNYFEWLNTYVTSVPDTTVDDSLKAVEAEAKYRTLKDQAQKDFEGCTTLYGSVVKNDPSMTFENFMGQYGSDYTNTCKLRDNALAALAGSDIRRAKQTIDSAQSRIEPRTGNNMPCSLQDFDVTTGSPLQDGPKDNIFRPLHYLSGYETAATRWLAESSKGELYHEVVLDFAKSATKTWASLGFPQFDLEATSIPTLPAGTRVVLRYTGLEAFDVRRGLWDVTDPRIVLPPLPAIADEVVKNKTNKTVRLLLGYNVSIVVTLDPKIVDEVVQHDTINALMPELGGLPFTQTSKTQLVAGPQSQGAYPVLLGVLTAQV